MPTKISLTVDKRIGVEPKSVTGEEGRRSYLIRQDGDGAAFIKSNWVLTRYHRTFIVLPEGTMREGQGFEWKGLPTERPTVKSARNGRVTFTSALEGTVYRFAIRETERIKGTHQRNASKGSGLFDMSLIYKTKRPDTFDVLLLMLFVPEASGSIVYSKCQTLDERSPLC